MLQLFFVHFLLAVQFFTAPPDLQGPCLAFFLANPHPGLGLVRDDAAMDEPGLPGCGISGECSGHRQQVRGRWSVGGFGKQGMFIFEDL